MEKSPFAERVCALTRNKTVTTPTTVLAGFLVFTVACGVLDHSVLMKNYTLPEPAAVEKQEPLEPQTVTQTVAVDENQYKNLASLTIQSSDSKSGISAQAEAAALLKEEPSFFESRYGSYHVELPAPAAVPEPQPEPTPAITQAVPEPAAATPAPAPAAQQGGTKTADKKTEPPQKVTIQPAGGSDGASQMNYWKQINSDVMGYLRIPGSNIDYPVVQTADTLYYTSKDINKNYSKNGVIWADQDVNPNSNNIVLYGHNWTNVSSNPRIGNASDVMFGQLTGYHHLSYAQSHPTIQYANANGNATWVVFAVFYTTDLKFYIDCNVSPSSLAKTVKAMSLHDFSVDVKNSDQILTLSTCTRNLGQFENQRFVVMARKVRKGEDISNVTVKSAS